ncbi:MAG: homoserine dehydrogenase, partial [Planctomycetota bacterium]
MSAPFIRVLKFGSSVLRSEEDLPLAVHEIYRFLRRGERVVAVTSAIGDTTDELLARAGALDGEQQQDHLAALLATGEEAAAAMLAMACERAGLRVARLDAVHAGFRTSGPLGDAELTEIDTGRIHAALADCPLVVLAGFVGRSDCGRTAVLGRGGSDLTALFVAEQLDARRVRLIKAVDGIYDCDPIAT